MKVIEIFRRYRMERSRENAQDVVSADIGSGFREGGQLPIYATVSIDLNMNKAHPRFLTQLKKRGSHPLAADACNLPIRGGCLGRVYWRAVLEHLPNPIGAIVEGKRVLHKGGEAVCDLPIITNGMRYNLIVLLTGFPVSIIPIVATLIEATLYGKIPGVSHIRDVKPSHLKLFFKEIKVIKALKPHHWFRGPHTKFLAKVTHGWMMPDIQGQYHVRCK